MISWPLAKLGNHVDLLAGHAFKSRDFTEDPHDIRLLRGTNVGQGTLKWEHERRWPRSKAIEHRKFELAVDDIVLAMDRPWIEAGLKWSAVRERDLPMLLVQRVARLRGSRALSQDYLRYLIGSPQFSAYLRPIVTGVNVPHVSPTQIRDFLFRLPPRETQDSIVGLLRPMDDLIDDNERRIEILEEMAQLLYQEWFVHFRFPGHEDIELVDSDLGPIPEGWEVSQMSDVLETVGGGTPAKTEDAYWAGGTVQWFTPTDLTRAGTAFALNSASKITERGLKKSSAKLFPAGSVMMTSRATIGTISIAATPATTNQGFITCVPSDRLTSNYIYFWLHANVDLFLSLAGGATFKELRKSTFRELPILLPRQREIDSFEDSVAPMMSLLKNLLQQNQVLLEARDLLLPRLVSGELDVSELDLDLVAV